MTHDMLQRETDRRAMLRSTYLNYFRKHGRINEKNRICSLHEIVNKDITFERCQIAYTFVMGQSQNPPSGNRTELLSTTTTAEMTRPPMEPDIVSLDILENGKYGKSPTWFRYATLLAKEHNLPVDYIIKTDSDTLIIPARFIRWVVEQEAKVDYDRSHVYGGMPLDKKACGWPLHEDCQYLVAPYFHGGGLYFTSLDVAEYIVSDQCPRKTLFLPHEDVTMGNYVYSMVNTTGKDIHSFSNPNAYASTWKHPIKDPKRIRTLWREYLAKQTERRKKRNATSSGT